MKLGYLILCSCVFLLVACSDTTPKKAVPGDRGKRVVCVSNYPLKYFVERIGGSQVDTIFPARDAEDPATWEPDVNAVGQYQSADLIVLNGASYEKWLGKISLPLSRIVDTSAAFKERHIALQDDATHRHGPAGKHAHSGFAFTTWLDPQLAVEQARAVKDALIKLDASKAEMFEAAFKSLEEEWLDLDQRLTALLSHKGDKALIMSHPVYQYFTKRYGLNARSVHWEPGEMPGEDMWQELGEILKDHPAEWMIWESQPMNETVEKLKAMGVGCIVFDPCGSRPEQGNLLSVMNSNLEALARLQ